MVGIGLTDRYRAMLAAGEALVQALMVEAVAKGMELALIGGQQLMSMT